MIRVKRVYDPCEPDDGPRFLVDRLWPRGIKKESLRMDGWSKDAAPSNELRRWYGHDPARWEEFGNRYRSELEANGEAWLPLLEMAGKGNMTLLFSANDREQNNAVVLRLFLEERLKNG